MISIMRVSAAFFFCIACYSSASAEVINLAGTTCQDFQNSSQEEVAVILNWLDGYYKRENDLPVIDTARFLSNAKKLDEYCAAHPGTKLFTATAQLLDK